MPATRTPLPAWVDDRPSAEVAYTSANWVRAILKPVVPALAMLLPVTDRSRVAAFKPDSAVEKLMDNSSK